MLFVTVEKDVLEKFATLLENQEPGSCIRLREYTLGSG